MSDTGVAPHLFQPLRLGDIELKNRIVMAPMTRNRADADEAPHGLNVRYYAQRASAGLILSEATQITPQGRSYPGTPGIHSAAQVAGWRQVTTAVHEGGGRIFMQIVHGGRISHPSLQPGKALPVAPSPLRPRGQTMTTSGLRPFVMPRALDGDGIKRIVGDFAEAAVKADSAGFDGVELHAANGYLLDQFLRDSTNLRRDRYGGSIENRARFLLEVTDVVVAAIGRSRVGVKLSPMNAFNDIADSDPQHSFGYVARELGRRGLAYLHVTRGGDDGRFDWSALRNAFGGSFMLNGDYDARRALEALAGGAADLIAFGVAFLANPDLVERLRRGAALNAPHRPTFYGGGAEGYTDYPALDDPPPKQASVHPKAQAVVES
jgi:N-ethylmaleimide reductase